MYFKSCSAKKYEVFIAHLQIDRLRSFFCLFRGAATLPLLAFCLILTGCDRNQTATNTTDKLQIMVSIAPQKYFVERIGDDYVTVNLMVPPGSEPHTFEPKPEQLKAISRASAYMRIGIDFEDAWMGKIAAANPKMSIVDTTQGIERIPMQISEEEGETAKHGEGGENLDPHIWLSPQLVKIQAKTIYEALSKLDVKHQEAYRKNLELFLADIDRLDAGIRKSLQGIKNRKIIVFHPSWGYFARDYQLEQIPIEVGGQEPSAAELGALVSKMKQEKIKIIFAEPQFSQQTADTIAKEIGGEVLLVDPLSPDWLNNLRDISNTFAKVLSGKPEAQIEHSQSKIQN